MTYCLHRHWIIGLPSVDLNLRLKRVSFCLTMIVNCYSEKLRNKYCNGCLLRGLFMRARLPR